MSTIHYEKRGHIVIMTMEGDNDLNIGVGPLVDERI